MSGNENVCFTQSQVVAIAQALGHAVDGLTGPEIEHLLELSRIEDIHPDTTKWEFNYEKEHKETADCAGALVF